MIDHTLSTKVSKAGKLAVLIVCIDDIVLFGYDITKIIQLKKKMGDEFEINDLGNLKYFLRMGQLDQKKVSSYLKGSIPSIC